MSTTTKITVPVKSFRRVENPLEKEGKKMYLAVIQAKDLPKELENWRNINPRDPKTSSGVAKKIAESLNDAPENFLFRNRGITLLSERADYDNEKNTMSIEFSNPTIHGLLDGGHTYAVIMEAFESLTDGEKQASNLNNAYVKVEILEGFREKEETTEIVGARNTSTQVKDQSIANLLDHFGSIKDILANEPYANRIAYKETEFADDGSKKDIDIKEILSYLVCFDCEGFDGSSHPIIAYSGKSAVLSYADSEDNRKRLQKYLPLLPQILQLHDEIYDKMPEAYNAHGGKFGRLMGINMKNSKSIELPFINSKTQYVIPSSFIYPVLASFRNLVDVSDNKCSWKKDPIKFFNEAKSELIQRLGDQALELRNPNKLGKDKATWRACYDYVALEVMKLHL